MVVGIDASRANRKVKTGVEWYSYHIIEALKDIVPNEVTIRLYSDTPLEGRLARLPNNWESRVLRWPPRYLWTVLRLSAELFSSPPDILFVPGSALPFVLPKRTVTTLHDIGFVRLPKAYRRRSRLYLLFNARRAIKHCARIITISTFSKDEIEDVYDVSGEKIVVTPLAAHRTTVAQKNGSSSSQMAAPYFLYVGRLESKKNIAGIVRAFSQFRTANPIVELVLVGARGYGAEEIDHLLDELGATRITVLPWVSEDERLALLAGAKAFIFPSFYEGFGMPILEAFHAGVPVVTADRGAMREVAGDAALLVDLDNTNELAEAMKHIVEDTALVAELVHRGHNRASQFSWQNTAQKTWHTLAVLL
ncbi:hypothetical protein COV04_03730 [Candidatus Uhrbacteria bacterium CG10_big_fil_rev_8_21_14_0_10_48_11]|uniref:Glycosyltransferase family 1 protein n=1 Tax=Candidatus Uhrbacteria bacterium CG10_big_fil_rev_8_21_14_0_10_48_11 TaxID=1975037 RepID=A0A2M8LE26_9BACT|nr:MAG: hypothetical protein COV04_03730 [Candidatus Uhrbacteria bacterium CG10_big_fil_rev_8_21_14_0_10_48_11]